MKDGIRRLMEAQQRVRGEKLMVVEAKIVEIGEMPFTEEEARDWSDLKILEKYKLDEELNPGLTVVEQAHI